MTDQEKINYLESQIKDVKRSYYQCKKELAEHKVISENRKNKIKGYKERLYNMNEAIRTIKEVAKQVQPTDTQPLQ